MDTSSIPSLEFIVEKANRAKCFHSHMKADTKLEMNQFEKFVPSQSESPNIQEATNVSLYSCRKMLAISEMTTGDCWPISKFDCK